MTNFDVEGYTSKFNVVASKVSWTAADEATLKEAYVKTLPFRLRETMIVHRPLDSYSLAQCQQEATRVNKVMGMLLREKPERMR